MLDNDRLNSLSAMERFASVMTKILRDYNDDTVTRSFKKIVSYQISNDETRICI